MVSAGEIGHTSDKAASGMWRKEWHKALLLLASALEEMYYYHFTRGRITMSAEENNQVARRFIKAFQAGDTADLSEIVAQDFVDHNPQPGQKAGRQGLIETIAGWRTAFPDLEITVQHEVAEGEFVVQQGVALGTNTGPLMGRPATGKQARVSYMDMHRIVNGRIVEIWHLEDIAGMLYQLGAMSA
jgi:steroid delta-isomerase-like uncharacterized protein